MYNLRFLILTSTANTLNLVYYLCFLYCLALRFDVFVVLFCTLWCSLSFFCCLVIYTINIIIHIGKCQV